MSYSVTGTGASALEQLARRPDALARGSVNGDAGPTAVEGGFAGRLVRGLRLVFSDLTQQEKADNRAGHLAVLNSLRQTFGEDIGTRAFRAHFGRSDGNGGWMTDVYQPITGRHVAKMLASARTGLAEAHDGLRMRQISVGGMAGPFSKGVCKAATADWFRRIDQGLPSWGHTRLKDGLDKGTVIERNSVDWMRKRERLQTIQDRGQEQDSRFQTAGRVYSAQHVDGKMGLHGIDLACGNDLAGIVLESAAKRLSNGEAGNLFFQLNVTLAGRVGGQVDHAIGIQVVPKTDDPTGPEDFEVHVFDSNEREARGIPGERFGAWLSSHAGTRYDDRVRRALVLEVSRAPIERNEPRPPQQTDDDDFSIVDS